ncbi:MAG TPA: hypothetical protein VGM31_05165 [Puia sp.]|jgi:hypothetical protein
MAVHAQLPAELRDLRYPLLFDSIRVVDFRGDTSRIGLASNGHGKQVEVLLNGSVTARLTGYLNARYSAPTAKHHLLVAIKDLWVSDPDSAELNLDRSHWSIGFRWEAYLSAGDGYIPLTYMDTVGIYRDYSPTRLVSHKLPYLITAFMDRIADYFLLDGWTRKRMISYAQIDSFARSRFHYAIDTARQLVKGVYASVDEFRKNAPSIERYEITKDKDSLLELRIPDENGRLYYTHEAWGYCDGQRAYMMMDGNVFPVFSVGHQFYVLGSKEYGHRRVWVPFYAPMDREKQQTADAIFSCLRG